MNINTKTDKVLDNFFEYLNSKGISKISHKNYRSDIHHFLGWLIFKLRSTWGTDIEHLGEAAPYLKPDLAREYREYLKVNSIATSTIDRRLSTLRHLGKFFLTSQIMDFDFMSGVSNASAASAKAPEISITQKFESHLYTTRISKKIVKNHVQDVEHFLDWLEKNHPQLFRKTSS